MVYFLFWHALSHLATGENKAGSFIFIPGRKTRSMCIPALANCDFGHTTPVLTLPNGGRCRLRVREGKSEILVTEH